MIIQNFLILIKQNCIFQVSLLQKFQHLSLVQLIYP